MKKLTQPGAVEGGIALAPSIHAFVEKVVELLAVETRYSSAPGVPAQWTGQIEGGSVPSQSAGSTWTPTKEPWSGMPIPGADDEIEGVE